MEIREIDDPRLVKALAHPLRIQILNILSTRVASPSEIADEVGARLTNVSYHVRFLERVGVIKLVRTRPRRGAVEHYYQARGRLRLTERAWKQVPELIKGAVVDAALAQAISQITAAASTGGFSRDDAIGSRWSITLDDQGFREVSAVLVEALNRIREIEEQSAKRLAADDHAAMEIQTGLVITLFEAAPQDSPDVSDGHHPGQKSARDGRTARAGRQKRSRS